MPIELITGLPGTGKTAWLVDRIMTEGEKRNPRPLVAMGINGLEPGLAAIVDDPKRWAEIVDRTQGDCTCPLIGGDIDPSTGTYQPHTHRIPKGAIVFVDEAWKWFGHLHDASRQATPKHVLDLAEHRHMGIDFVWTTQGPAQIYPFARQLVADHTHLVRKFRTQILDVYKWGELNEDVKSEGKRMAALRSTRAIPSRAYGKYKSSEEHTIKSRVPWRVFALPVLLLAAVLAGWFAFRMLQPDAVAKSVGLGTDAASAAAGPRTDESTPSRATPRRPATPAEYAALHLPRFATMPHTAPVFDDREPLSDPLLMCMAGQAGTDAQGEFKDSACTCLTEQGTRYDIADGECRRVARWGQPYNPYRRSGQQMAAGDRQPLQERPVERRGPSGPMATLAGEGGPAARPAAYGGMREAAW
ncbi:zonular occludens toxin domain-containing protein [Luteimonas saliphila]|uniref:zonular occludens toxin domain-containing protein n=1 Tax=Luteimonas saliphila TaxID=2804919 RepID=UPI00192E25CB|nr:zonular occludens toxin domain-containing protein [Luteimonas saliphila]